MPISPSSFVTTFHPPALGPFYFSDISPVTCQIKQFPKNRQTFLR